MIELEQLKYTLNSFQEPLENLSGSLALEAKRERIAQLELNMEEPGFWDDVEASQNVMKEVKGLKSIVEEYESLKTKYEDVETLLDMAEEDDDEELVGEAADIMEQFEKQYEELRISTLLTGEYDKNDAVLTLHAGAGGTESCDWADMLYRMYSRWAEKKGFKVSVLDYLPGEEAGIKSVTFMVEGDMAYGYLKAEKGVHRLVRISPFDSGGRRHTSFASLDVMPQFNNEIEIEIKPEDLLVETKRASGAGGQHINKTDSAVRMVHKPTGLVATCQNGRSQHENREEALRILKSRLYQKMIEEQEAKLAEIKGEQKLIEWGSQIRSYVFHPYSMVKDHRTNVETSDIQGVMDGDLDNFIYAYLKSMIK